MHREELQPCLLEGKQPTKRLVARCVMGFFDPLGLLSPFTIHGKIIIHHLCRSNCGWDNEIDEKSWTLWQRWINLLPEVETIRIPHCHLGGAKPAEVDPLEVHIFTDASEHAYGCLAYLRAIIEGEVRCSLMMSRTKVAPIKRQSIPRLKLMGAVLGTRMSQTILSTHAYQIARTVIWMDSCTVCSWLNSDQHRYKQFVAFRVGEIQELTKWGQGPPLQSDGDWFCGPSFLYRPQKLWPTCEVGFEETNEEAQGVVLFHGAINVEPISSWAKLLRVTATVVRFIANCRRKRRGEPIVIAQATTKQQQLMEKIAANHESVKAPLWREELQQAETILWWQAQWNSFPDDMSTLTNNLKQRLGARVETIKKSSQIYKSSPTLDDERVLRIGGWLANCAESSLDKRHPIILSRSHAVTQNLMQHYHEQFGHGNSKTVFNEMRQRFQIPKMRPAIQGVFRLLDVAHSTRALDDGSKVNDEILATTLAEAADMINTRPLTYLSQDSGEVKALTPNHFLRGTVSGADLEVEKFSTGSAEALRNV
ncbi:uncharacterized protein LOC134207461 [Armigeres subalbatus]|uniref:uncharacterized protein LOC134207461 n=1 Tax=Armigeres subalbatus TaxID=124917 RepID=UPI002ED0BB6A